MLLISPHKLDYHLCLLDYTTASISTLKINHSGNLVKHFLHFRRAVGFYVKGKLLQSLFLLYRRSGVGYLERQNPEPGVANSLYMQGMLVTEVGNGLETGVFTRGWT